MSEAPKNYSQKLRDPRWQKLRLEIMQRDGFSCKICSSTQKTLMVHHLKYTGNPWEAPPQDLITLCEDCHNEEHKNRGNNERDLLKMLRRAGFTHNHLSWLSTCIQTSDISPDKIIFVLAFFTNELDSRITKIVDKEIVRWASSVNLTEKTIFVNQLFRRWAIEFKDKIK